MSSRCFAAGRMKRGRTRRWAVARRRKSISGAFRRYAGHAMNHVRVGRVGHLQPDRGHSCAVSPVRSWNCTSSSSEVASTCRSSRCAAWHSRASRLLGRQTTAFALRANGSQRCVSTGIAKERVASASPTPLPRSRKPAESPTNRLENYLTRVHTTIAGRRHPSRTAASTSTCQ